MASNKNFLTIISLIVRWISVLKLMVSWYCIFRTAEDYNLRGVIAFSIDMGTEIDAHLVRDLMFYFFSCLPVLTESSTVDDDEGWNLLKLLLLDVRIIIRGIIIKILNERQHNVIMDHGISIPL